MDVQRVIDSGIPDVAPVFGGVRGRTLSSKHLKYAWPIIAEAGVKTVIDLRNLDSSNRLVEHCEQYGMEFFHYPVDKKKLNTEVMVDRLPRFCELIERGDFYIACAMGLHRTDIALCTYWVFYGAGRGIDPPVLRGYLKESGHDTSKILRVLNAFYDELANRNGQEPMSVQEFKRRKQIINEQSKRSTEETRTSN